MTDKVELFFRILSETKEPAYDVETTGLDWKHDRTVGYSVSDGKVSVYIPVRHEGGGNIADPGLFERRLSDYLTKHTGTIVGHNVKFDMHFSENEGVNLRKVSDTMVREALLDENRRSYSLENVCSHYSVQPKKGKELYLYLAERFGCKPTRKDSMAYYHRLSGDDKYAVDYAEADTLCTKQLYDAQAKELYRQQLDTVSCIEDELTIVLQQMERRGVQTDPDRIASVKAEVAEMERKSDLATFTIDDDGYAMPINSRSNRHLREYFEACEIDDWPTTAPTKTHPNGQPSFTKDFLAATEEGLLVLNARKIQHLQSSFLGPIDTFLFHDKVHTTFNQTIGESHGTRTGRLSSAWPNMQQVPKRDKELGKIYRSIFIPRPGYVFAEFDYSQAEPRLFSHYSGEPVLIRGYNSTPCIDMHQIAAEYMGIDRDTAKSLNLGVMYTMGPKKLSVKLGISYDEAIRILNRWQQTFPRVSNYSRDYPGFTQLAAAAAENRGYVRTILGRRSRFDDRRFAYRAANRIVQGGSADILKYKLCELDRYIKGSKLESVCRMLLTIHDSILFEIHKDHSAQLIVEIKRIMEQVNGPPFNLTVPFVAEYKTGHNWSEATYG